jgi:hypothetical protein
VCGMSNMRLQGTIKILLIKILRCHIFILKNKLKINILRDQIEIYIVILYFLSFTFQFRMSCSLIFFVVPKMNVKNYWICNTIFDLVNCYEQSVSQITADMFRLS